MIKNEEKLEKALKNYNAAHYIWVNTNIFSDEAREAKANYEEARDNYLAICQEIKKERDIVIA